MIIADSRTTDSKPNYWSLIRAHSGFDFEVSSISCQVLLMYSVSFYKFSDDFFKGFEYIFWSIYDIGIHLNRKLQKQIESSGSNGLDQIFWIKLSGPNCLDQIAWIKLSGSNCLDHSESWVLVSCRKKSYSNQFHMLMLWQ